MRTILKSTSRLEGHSFFSSEGARKKIRPSGFSGLTEVCVVEECNVHGHTLLSRFEVCVVSRWMIHILYICPRGHPVSRLGSARLSRSCMTQRCIRFSPYFASDVISLGAGLVGTVSHRSLSKRMSDTFCFNPHRCINKRGTAGLSTIFLTRTGNLDKFLNSIFILECNQRQGRKETARSFSCL